MKKVNFLILRIALLTVIISGCSSTEVVPKGEFATGVVIINEGNFSEANGTIGFYNESASEVSQDIFEKANGVTTGGLI